MSRSLKIVPALLIMVLVAAPVVVPATPASAVSSSVVISQVYGGGGNTGATYQNDFIELHNVGSSSVDLSGWSVQYASVLGTTWQKSNLSGTLPTGGYFLIQAAAGAGNGVPLPTADATSTLTLGASGGKIALVANQTSLPIGACPGGWVDFVGYGTTDCYEGTTAAPAPSAALADLRAGSGCTDTDDNGADFSTAVPAARNSATAAFGCVADTAPAVSSTTPVDGATGVTSTSDVSITFSEAIDYSVGWVSITCSPSGARTYTVSGGPTTFTLNPDTDLPAGETCTVTVTGASVSDQDSVDPPDTMASNFVFGFTVADPVTRGVDSAVKAAQDAGFLGEGTVNTTGSGQVMPLKVARKKSGVFTIRVTNTGTASDSFTIVGSPKAAGFSVTYLDGATNITSAVVGPGYPLADIAPSASHDLTLKVKVGRSARGSKLFLVTSTSQADAGASDVVGAKVRVKA